LIRVHASAIAAVKIGGVAPVAVAGLGGTSRMTASQTEYFAVAPGDAVAVMATTRRCGGLANAQLLPRLCGASQYVTIDTY